MKFTVCFSPAEQTEHLNKLLFRSLLLVFGSFVQYFMKNLNYGIVNANTYFKVPQLLLVLYKTRTGMVLNYQCWKVPQLWPRSVLSKNTGKKRKIPLKWRLPIDALLRIQQLIFLNFHHEPPPSKPSRQHKVIWQ